MPKVSVIMSIYRPNERFLCEQLASIDAQDFDNMDIFVYNDCPDDLGWGDLCHECCPRHVLSYIEGQENLGYKKAFEKLVDIADGTYLAFSDQDDRWLPGRIAAGVKALDAGNLLASCDMQIIDETGRVVLKSNRHHYCNEHMYNWKTGERFASKAVFSCYSIGMSTMIRADTARTLRPYPTCTGHDKWLALGANTLGSCANIDEVLVQYRRHSDNLTGVMNEIYSKQDWRNLRTKVSLELAQTYAERFSNSPDAKVALEFARARWERDNPKIWKLRELAPNVALFEIAMNILPEWAFRRLVRAVKKQRSFEHVCKKRR